MSLNSWGNYPKKENITESYSSYRELTSLIQKNNSVIPCGNGRSYGDSALNDHIIDNRPHNLFLSFDEKSGLLHAESGVLLSDILEVFVPKGWFLKVTPGTKFITIGGAIASDVHGKNHHVEGCFSSCLKEFDLMLADGSILTCSNSSNTDLYHATCGGMGLTGNILNAKIYLKKIHSQYIDQITVKTKNLKDTFDAFEEYKNYNYSVAWIDCLAKGEQLGRCLLNAGEFCNDNDLNYKPGKKLNIPFYFPSFTLNKFTVKLFNTLYYRKIKGPLKKDKVSIDSFFYPLDSLDNWNRIYGRNGFTQYQFILPIENSYQGMQEILQTIAISGKGSFLAVLKLYGEANENWLSFPMKGYSLALDFKIEPSLFELLDNLDAIVMKYGGRIYLAKDARVKKSTFQNGYPHFKKFIELRKKYRLDEKFNSLQSMRIGI